MLHVPSLSMLAYCSSAFGDKELWLGHWLLKTAMTEFRIKSFVCFIQVSEYGVSNFFMPARLWALAEGGSVCLNEGVLVPLSRGMKANVIKRGLLRLISDCTVNPVSAFFALAGAGGAD